MQLLKSQQEEVLEEANQGMIGTFSSTGRIASERNSFCMIIKLYAIVKLILSSFESNTEHGRIIPC